MPKAAAAATAAREHDGEKGMEEEEEETGLRTRFPRIQIRSGGSMGL